MKTAEIITQKIVAGGLLVVLLMASAVEAGAAEGIATFYTVKSCQREGTSGVYTANGERYNEGALTCALRRRDWGGRYRVTNTANGRSVIVRHNDFGPGKGPTKRGVVVDLTPAAFDALGGNRGETWGEIKVKVERL